jgi:hypothetical protein
MSLGGSVRLDLTAKGAEIIAREDGGNPVFTCHSYGKGKVFFFAFPLETELLRDSCIFSTPDADSYAEGYRIISEDIRGRRIISGKPPQLGITEHPVSDNERIAVMVNMSPEKMSSSLVVKNGWEIAETLYGEAPEKAAPQPSNGHAYTFNFLANDGAVVVLRQTISP